MGATRIRNTEIYIGTTAATASSDTYTKIGGAKMLSGALGVEWSEIDATTLDDNYRQSVKGVGDAGDIEIGGNYDHADTGQTALKAAADDDDDTNVYNIKIVQPNGRLVYLKGRVMSFRVQYGTNANLKEFRAKASLTAAYTEAAAA